MGQTPRPEIRFDRGRFWRSLVPACVTWFGFYTIATVGFLSVAAFLSWSPEPFFALDGLWARIGAVVALPMGAISAWMNALVAVPRPLPPQPPRLDEVVVYPPQKGTH